MSKKETKPVKDDKKDDDQVEIKTGTGDGQQKPPKEVN